eukprot:Pgem_evm1s5427
MKRPKRSGTNASMCDSASGFILPHTNNSKNHQQSYNDSNTDEDTEDVDFEEILEENYKNSSYFANDSHYTQRAKNSKKNNYFYNNNNSNNNNSNSDDDDDDDDDIGNVGNSISGIKRTTAKVTRERTLFDDSSSSCSSDEGVGGILGFK